MNKDNENNNPLIEQFRKEIISQESSIKEWHWNEILMILFKTKAISNWVTIKFQINSLQRVLHRDSGNYLCLFAIDVIANGSNSDSKISEITLNLGVECLKSLVEINIDEEYSLSQEQKINEKRIRNELLDFWKEWLKNSLKQENMLV